MVLTFVSCVDRRALTRAADTITALVTYPEVGAAWEKDSVLPGMTVGGLTRHLVSQVETAVEFLSTAPPPPRAVVVSLADLYRRTDWFSAPLEAAANTSICEDFNALAAGGQEDAAAVLAQARRELPAVAASAGAMTYVPWQDCVVATEDFIVVRLMEVLVHADDLATSLGLPALVFDEDVTHPVAALLGLLCAQQHGGAAAVRWLARPDRTPALGGAFQAPSQ